MILRLLRRENLRYGSRRVRAVKQKNTLLYEIPRDSIIGIPGAIAAFEEPKMPHSSDSPAPVPKLPDQLRNVIRRKYLPLADSDAAPGGWSESGYGV